MTRYKRAFPCAICGGDVIYNQEEHTTHCINPTRNRTACPTVNTPRDPINLRVMWDAK